MFKFVSIDVGFAVQGFGSKRTVCQHFGQMGMHFTRIGEVGQDGNERVPKPEAATYAALYRRLETDKEVFLSTDPNDREWDYKVVCLR